MQQTGPGRATKLLEIGHMHSEPGAPDDGQKRSSLPQAVEKHRLGRDRSPACKLSIKRCDLTGLLLMPRVEFLTFLGR